MSELRKVRFEILGAVRAYVDEDQVAVTRSQRVLLATLLLHANELVETDRLVDAIWGDRPPRNARNQVQGCVSRLRKRLATAGVVDPIITDRVGYEIQVQAGQLDLRLFRQHVNQARTAARHGRFTEAATEYRAALAGWRGPALTGVDSDLLRLAATALDEERLQVTEERIDIELGQGAAGDLIAELTDLVAQYPYREGIHAALMVALYRSGRRADALATYQRVHRTLIDEVGTEPGQSLRDLQQRILNGDETLMGLASRAAEAGVPAGARNCLPRAVGDFTGRPDAIAQLLDLAEPVDRAPNVLAIDGMAGIGKTTLAIHVAHLLADRYPDAQLFVDLHGHSERRPTEPAAALDVLLRQLGVAGGRIPMGLDERVSLWRSEVARCRALVVLDNAANSAQVTPLLPGTANCLVMVTSRLSLAGLDAARPVSLDLLTTDEAVALLAKIVGIRVTEEPESSVEVARSCGHLPLAIRLAGARLAHRASWRVGDLADRLLGARELLAEFVAEDRTVADAFALSYSQLEPDSQRAFRLLGLHPGEEFDSYAVAALVACGLDTARQTLDDLVDRHLLLELKPGRYRFHDLVREYAHRLVSTVETKVDRTAALKQLLDFYLHAAVDASRSLEGMIRGNTFRPGKAERPDLVVDTVDRGIEWLEIERPNLVAAVRSAAASGADQYAWQLARAGWAFYYYRGYVDDLLETHRGGLIAAERQGLHEIVATMCNYLASAHYKTGEMGHAEALLKRALEIRLSCDRVAAGNTRTNLALVCRRLGRLSDAVRYSEEALVDQQRDGDLRGLANTLQNLGLIYIDLSQYDKAARCHRRRLSLCREAGDLPGVANPLGSLGAIRTRLGESDAALRLLMASFRVTGQVPHGVSA